MFDHPAGQSAVPRRPKWSAGRRLAKRQAVDSEATPTDVVISSAGIQPIPAWPGDFRRNGVARSPGSDARLTRLAVLTDTLLVNWSI